MSEKNNIEARLAAALVAWLENMRWEVYQEVQVRYGDSIADIVAKQGNIIWAIECKTNLGLKVMEQACCWKAWANYVSVATSPAKDRRFAHSLCEKHLGIGVLQIAKDWEGNWFVTEKIPPKLRRKILPDLKNCLVEEHKTYAKAGNAMGKRYTPFQNTCDKIRRVVGENPGISLKDLIENIDHHYSSTATASSCISKWARAGIIKGIRLEREGRFLKFYPDPIPPSPAS